jgi:AraC family transcriptional regulator
MAPFRYELKHRPGTPPPLKRSLVDRPEIQLDHITLPAASLRHENLPAHMLAVHASAAVRYDRRVAGRRLSGWMAPRPCVIAPAGSSSSGSWDAARETYVLSMAPSLVDRLLQDDTGGAPVALVHRQLGQDAFLSEAIKMMARSAESDAPYGSLFLDGLTLSVVAHLGRETTRTARSKGGLAPWQLRRVLELIEHRLGEDVSLAALATEAGLSERYFCSAFRRSIGTPPYRYMLERRIMRAKDMLRDRRHVPIIEVAMAVGFPTSAHFATMFRKVTGLTPSSFRSGDNEAQSVEMAAR